MRTKKAPAYLASVIRSAIYGSSVLFTGRLLQTVDGFDVLALRFFITAAAFLILGAFKVVDLGFLKKKEVLLLIPTALFEPVLYFIFETFGIAGTTAIVAGLIFATTSVFTMLFETLILGERTTSLQKGFMFLRISGAVIVVFAAGGGGKNTVFGVVCAFMAAISGALFCVFSRKSSESFGSMEITCFTSFSGFIVFNAINVCRHISGGTLHGYFSPLFDRELIVGFLFLSLLSSILATALNNFSFSRIQASLVSALGGLSTVFTMALGVFVNGEKLGLLHLISAALLILGGVGMNMVPDANSKDKEVAV